MLGEPFGIVPKDSQLCEAGRIKAGNRKAMKGGNRHFCSGIVNHTYQRPIEGDVIFYCISDYLVFFTIFCTVAPRYQVRVLRLCQMPDHVHGSIVAMRKTDLWSFVRDYTSIFVKEHNETCHRQGPFFQSPFGSAPKYGDKKARSNFIYLDNNPVERKLCEKAEQYRWNYLAYAENDHPFSEPYREKGASKAMKRAVGIVKDRHGAGKHLPYALLKRLFKPLKWKEQQQLVDIIISTYSIIEHEEVLRFFDSFDDMLTAIHSTTGSEHDINEVFIGTDDRWYARMANIVMKHCGLKDIHDMLAFSNDRKYELFLLLRRKTVAPAGQIAIFLRMKYKKGEEMEYVEE